MIWLEILIFVPVLIAFALFLLGLGIYVVARQDTFWTLVKLNQIKTLLKGESIDRLAYNARDKDLKELPNGAPVVGRKPHPRRHWLDFPSFGLFWVGIPPIYKVLYYKFLWNKWTQINDREKKDNRHIIVARAETVNSLYIRYLYPFIIDNILMEGNIPVKITVLITIEVETPEITISESGGNPGDWIDRLQAQVAEATRDWAGSQPIENLRKGEAGDFRSKIEQLNDITLATVTTSASFSKGLPQAVGVRIIDVDFQGFQFKDPKLQTAFEQEALAQQTAKGIAARAEGQANAIRKIADAQAYKDTTEGAAKKGVLASVRDLNVPDSVLETIAAGMNTSPIAQLPRRLETFVGNSDHFVPTLPIGSAQTTKQKKGEEKEKEGGEEKK